MTWEQYYDGFYDWAESTQINRISKLANFGSNEEVAEIAIAFCDEKIASRFVEKAIAFNVEFTSEQIVELASFIKESTLKKLIQQSKNNFTPEQLEELDCNIDYDTSQQVKFKQLLSNPKLIDNAVLEDILENLNEAQLDKLAPYIPLTINNQILLEENFFALGKEGMRTIVLRLSHKPTGVDEDCFEFFVSCVDRQVAQEAYECALKVKNKTTISVLENALNILPVKNKKFSFWDMIIVFAVADAIVKFFSKSKRKTKDKHRHKK